MQLHAACESKTNSVPVYEEVVTTPELKSRETRVHYDDIPLHLSQGLKDAELQTNVACLMQTALSQMKIF